MFEDDLEVQLILNNMSITLFLLCQKCKVIVVKVHRRKKRKRILHQTLLSDMLKQSMYDLFPEVYDFGPVLSTSIKFPFVVPHIYNSFGLKQFNSSLVMQFQAVDNESSGD